MQDIRKIKTEDEITLLNTACAMVDSAYDDLYRAMKPGFRENECVALVNKVLFELGSEHVEGVNAISGERCSPASARLHRPHAASGRPRVLRHPPRVQRLPHLLLPHVRGRQSASRALVDAYKRCRDILDNAISMIRPGVTTAEVVETFPKAQEFGFPDEEAAFALQYGHGVGLSIWEKPIFSRLVSFDYPEMIEEGMVFALETFWPAADGWQAARIEEQLVVTADGCEVITRFPAEELLVTAGGTPPSAGRLPGEREVTSNLNNPRLVDAVVESAASRRDEMPTDVIMPALGMAQETGKVLRWLQAGGRRVAKGEPLLEIETDKVTVEIEAPAAGTLPASPQPTAREVPVGKVIAVVLADGESRRDPESRPAAIRRQRIAPSDARGAARVARKRDDSQERGIDLDALAAAGPNGAVVAADIERHTAPRRASPGEPRRRLRGRLGLARDGGADDESRGRTCRTSSSPATSTRRGSRAGAPSRAPRGRARESHRPARQALRRGAAPSPARERVVARRLDRARRRINVGIAVAADEGLVVPVVPTPISSSCAISARRIEIAAAARAGRLRPEDVQGGTFTVSNLGMYGVDAFQAIVNAPQAAILAVGRIARPARRARREVVVRPMLTLSVSFDHRVVDGAAVRGSSTRSHRSSRSLRV